MQWCKAAKTLIAPCELGDSIVEWALEHITDGLFVDGGAHVGLFCIPVLLARPEARCVAFEPNSVALDVLEEMAELNGVEDRLTAYDVALFDFEGSLALKVPAAAHKCGFSTLGKPKRFGKHYTEIVTTAVLDRYGLAPQLIKFDLEGAELHALSGATGTIMAHRPAIITEAFEPNTAQFGYKPSEIEELLKTLGYTCNAGRQDLFCTS